MMIRISIITIFVLGMNWAHAQFISPLRIDSFLLELYNRDVFHGGIAIVDQKNTAYIATFGISDTSRSLLTKELPFNSASLAKPVTAWAVTKLAAEGKLSLHDSISRFIPELAVGDLSKITIQNLLHHTSGVPDYFVLFNKYPEYLGRFATIDSLIQILKVEAPPLEFETGKGYAYSNTGYVLLAEVVERISKQTLDEYLRENLFEVLGIQGFVYSHKWPEISQKPRIKGLEISGSFTGEYDLGKLDGIYGDANLYFSLDDWILWLKYLNSSEKWDSNHYDLYNSPPAEYLKNLPNAQNYGMGQIWSKDTVEAYHSGKLLGFSTFLWRNTVEDYGFIVFDNATINANDFNVITSTLRDILFTEVEKARYSFNLNTNSEAPVTIYDSFFVNAAPEEIYRALTNRSAWVDWHEGISKVSDIDSTKIGETWKWKLYGKKYKSEFHTLNAPYSIGWTDRRIGEKIIFNWTIRPEKSGCTIVIRKSYEGFKPSVFTKKNYTNGQVLTRDFLLELQEYLESQ